MMEKQGWLARIFGTKTTGCCDTVVFEKPSADAPANAVEATSEAMIGSAPCCSASKQAVPKPAPRS
jgi:hypothetical protein